MNIQQFVHTRVQSLCLHIGLKLGQILIQNLYNNTGRMLTVLKADKVIRMFDKSRLCNPYPHLG